MVLLRSIICLGVFLFSISMLLRPAEAQPLDPTIDPDDEGQKFAYGETVDWFNFKPAYNGQYFGVEVTESELKGFIWNQDIGWINFTLATVPQSAVKTEWDHVISPETTDGTPVRVQSATIDRLRPCRPRLTCLFGLHTVFL